MPIVLIVSNTDLTPELGETMLWRSGIERVFVTHEDAAVATARRLRPDLVMVDGTDPRSAAALLRRLRSEPSVGDTSLAVVSRTVSVSLADEEALRRAGANLVLAGPVDPSLWDWRLTALLSVPRRKHPRIPVNFGVWSDRVPARASLEGEALNISLRGLLLEADRSPDVGTQLDLWCRLPDEHEPLQAVGRVVWEARADGGRRRSGVEFVSLHGEARSRLRHFLGSEAQI